jgi:hypothetical protein
VFDPNLETGETVRKENICRSANLEEAIWKYQL